MAVISRVKYRLVNDGSLNIGIARILSGGALFPKKR